MKALVINRPTVDTKYHIDYDWWDKSNLDLKTYLYTRLDVEEDLTFDTEMEKVDLVDPETGEVRQVDGFQYVVQAYFSQMPNDFASRTSLVDAIFCVLLANANQPMTVRKIAERVQRDPDTVLRTIGGTQVYQGIRPVFKKE